MTMEAPDSIWSALILRLGRPRTLIGAVVLIDLAWFLPISYTTSSEATAWDVMFAFATLVLTLVVPLGLSGDAIVQLARRYLFRVDEKLNSDVLLYDLVFALICAGAFSWSFLQ